MTKRLPFKTSDDRKLLIGAACELTMISGRIIRHVRIIGSIGRELEISVDGIRDWVRVADLHEIRKA